MGNKGYSGPSSAEINQMMETQQKNWEAEQEAQEAKEMEEEQTAREEKAKEELESRRGIKDVLSKDQRGFKKKKNKEDGIIGGSVNDEEDDLSGSLGGL